MSNLIAVDPSAISATFTKGATEINIIVDTPVLIRPTTFTSAKLIRGNPINNNLTCQLTGDIARGQNPITAIKALTWTETVQINSASGMPLISGIMVTVGSPSASSPTGVNVKVPLTINPVSIFGNFTTTAPATPDSNQFVASAYFTKTDGKIVTTVRALSAVPLQNPRLVVDDEAKAPGGDPLDINLTYDLVGAISLDPPAAVSNPLVINFASRTDTTVSASVDLSKLKSVRLMACTDAQPNGQTFQIPLTIRENDTAPKPDLAPVWKPSQPSQVTLLTASAPQPTPNLDVWSTSDPTNTVLPIKQIRLPDKNFVRITAPVPPTNGSVEGRFSNENLRIVRTGSSMPGSVYWDITYSASATGSPRVCSFYVFTTTTGRSGGTLQQYFISLGS